MAAGSNHVLFMAIGDDLDINATNLIVGKIKYGESGELPSVKAVFHQRIYDESGEKVYTMTGMLQEGFLQTEYYYFFCPVFEVWFINVWLFMGQGVYRTTDTDYSLTYRNWFYITLPNTEGEWVQESMLMMLSPTAEYCLLDPGAIPPGEGNPVYTDLQPWVLTAVLCGIIVETPFGPVELPIGPVSYLTISKGL
ncbi:MAG: hypothetical protein ACFFG0_50570 [Candidatus Thorarchaeota archaeon]